MIYRLNINIKGMTLMKQKWMDDIPIKIINLIFAIWDTKYWPKDLCWIVIAQDNGICYLTHNIDTFYRLTIHANDDSYTVAVWNKLRKDVIIRKRCLGIQETVETAYHIMDKITMKMIWENADKRSADSLIIRLFSQAVEDYVKYVRRNETDKAEDILKWFQVMDKENLIGIAKLKAEEELKE